MDTHKVCISSDGQSHFIKLTPDQSPNTPAGTKHWLYTYVHSLSMHHFHSEEIEKRIAEEMERGKKSVKCTSPQTLQASFLYI